VSATPELAIPAPERSATVARPSLGHAVSAELLKLRRQRSTWVLMGAGVVVLALVLLVGTTSQSLHFKLLHQPTQGLDQWDEIMQTVFAAGAGIVLLIAGSRLMGMEYGLGTIRIILGRGTGRATLLAAKLLAMGMLALVLLLGFILLAAAGTVLGVLHQTGSLSLITHPPAGAWHNAGVSILSAAISEVACIAIAVTVSTIFRSLSVGMVVALLFFPIDNTLVLILSLLQRATHLSVFPKATGYLLGPALNHLPVLLKLEGHSGFAIPLVQVGLGQTLAVIAGWCALSIILAGTAFRWRDLLA